MTHNKNLWTFLCGTMFFLTACQNDAVQEVVENLQQPETVAVENEAYTTQVTTDDALRVATLFDGGSKAATRSDRTIKEVKTINDEEGNPAIYVVNYADNRGFVLVSATKNFLPVLAYDEEGNFTIPEGNVNGLSLWIDDQKRNMDVADRLPADSTARFRSEWRRYEERKGFNPPATRSDRVLDSYVTQMTSQWTQNEWVWAPLDQAATLVPEDVYESWCELAEGNMWPTYQNEYDYMGYSFVVEVRSDTGSGSVDNFVYSNWHQKGGFNDRISAELLGVDFPAGCTTIAMAQIMRYHEYPINKDWNNMPLATATSTTADFIYEVAQTIGVVYGLDGTSAGIGDVKRAFKEYGYSDNIERINHNATTVKTELDNRRPVCMFGVTDGGSGHCWVASGYSFLCERTDCFLYVPTQDVSTGSPYQIADSYLASEINGRYFYMNWGQGSSNGLYNDYNLGTYTTINKGITVAYDNNREDLIKIIPGE